MAKLIWSPRSLQDLDNACEYIARESPRYAYLFAERIVHFIESILDQPLWGAVVQEYNHPELRERLFQNYRIIYRIREDSSVELVTIIHAARLLPPNLPR
jgi:plasmid stabilization system protein ParE